MQADAQQHVASYSGCQGVQVAAQVAALEGLAMLVVVVVVVVVLVLAAGMVLAVVVGRYMSWAVCT
jgi:hypothetical protein